MTQSLRHTRPAQDDEPFVPAFKAMLRHMGKWVGIPALILVALMVIGSTCANAAMYYCSPTGDWTADGSIETPWGALGSTTVTKLETELTAGDTLICNDGDHGAITWSGFDEGAYVTFKAESAAAILDGINLGTGNHYISFSGFTVAYGNISCSTSSPYNSHLTFESITQYSSPNPFATTSDWVDSAKYSGIVMYYTDSLNVFNSTFSNNKNGGLFSIGDSTYVKGCTFDGWYDDGVKLGSNTYFADCIVTNQYDVDPAVHNDLLQIYTGSPPNSNITIERNFFRLHDYDRTSGYSEAQGIFTDEVTTNLIIRNNIVLTNWIAGIFLQDVDGVQIINNTVLPSDISAGNLTISVGDKNGTADNIYIYNNIAQAIGVSELAGDTYASSNNKLAPDDSLAVLFRDYSTFDLYPASTALEIINAGVDNDSIPDDDIRGYARPDTTTGLNDIGAYEYDASEEGDETPPEGDSRTAWYATVAGAGDTTGYDYNNALPASSIFDYGQYVTAGDTVYMKTGTLASLAMPVDTLTIIVTDALTIDGTLTIPSWTDNITAGGGVEADTTITAVASVSAAGRDLAFPANRDTMGYTSSAALATGKGNTSYWRRGFLTFPLPEMYDATACTLKVKCNTLTKNGGADFSIAAFSSFHAPAAADANFRKFWGWTWGDAHTGDSLTYWWSTAGWSAGSYINIVFTSLGLDSIMTYSADSLRLVLLTDDDFTFTEPDTIQLVQFQDKDDAGEEPKLILSYTTPGEAGADTLPSWYYLGYDPGAYVWFDGVGGTEVAYGDLDAEDEFTVSGDTLYVRYADKGKTITTIGNILIDNAGKIGTKIYGGGNLFVRSGVAPMDSIEYIERTRFYRLNVFTGADSAYRLTIANADSITGILVNSHLMSEIADAKESSTPTYTLFNGFSYLPSGAGNDTTTFAVTGYNIDDNQPWSALGVPYGYNNYTTSSVTVKTPNGSETLTVGTSYNITWSPSGSVEDSAKVYYGHQGGDWTFIATVIADSVYAWTVPDSAGTDWLIRVIDAANAANADQSDAVFTIEAAATPASTGNTNSWGNDTNSWADKPSWGTAW